MLCAECGTEIARGMRFCHLCGWDSKLAAAGRASAAHGHPAWKRWVMGVSLGLSCLLILVLLLVPRAGGQSALQVGQPAPDFTLETLEGETVRLSDLRGSPVVLNFWATWCQPCRREMPDFQYVFDRYREQGLHVFGINVGESKVAVADFRRRVGVSFPVMIDATEEVQAAYKILPLPATFFIDADGVIRAIYQGQMSRVQIESEVARLVEP